MQADLKEFIVKRNTSTPHKGPMHQYLDAFIGNWKIEGSNGETAPSQPSAEITGDESFEWLEGEYFLVNKFHRLIGRESFSGLGWISYDSTTDSYLSYSISSSGFLRIYEIEILDRQISFIGETERAVLRLIADGHVMTCHWEHCNDGKSWETLCEFKGHRLI